MRRRYIVVVAAVLHFVVLTLLGLIAAGLSSYVWSGIGEISYVLMLYPVLFFVSLPWGAMLYPLNSVVFGLGVAWLIHRRRLRRSGAVAPDGVCDEMAGTGATLRVLVAVALLLGLCLVPIARTGALTTTVTFILLFCAARFWIVRFAIARCRDVRWCRRVLAGFACVVLGSFCLLVLVPYPPSRPSEADRSLTLSYAETVEAVRKLVAGRSVPLHLRCFDATRWRTDFDVNRYFSILTRIGPEPGYVLDYVCGASFLGTAPILYGRKKWMPPYLTGGAWFPRDHNGEMQPVFDGSVLRVQCDESPEGYVQLLILFIEGPRFYRSGVMELLESRIVADRAEMDRRLDLADQKDVADAIRRAGPEPVVEMGQNSVSVTVLTSQGTDGLERTTYTITRTKPHRIEETRRQVAKSSSSRQVLY